LTLPRRATDLPSPADTITKLLQRLAADHDGAALIVAKTVGSLMFEDGPRAWYEAMSRVRRSHSRRPSLGPIDLESFANGLSMRRQKQ
jgi:hypothetical protein